MAAKWLMRLSLVFIAMQCAWNNGDVQADMPVGSAGRKMHTSSGKAQKLVAFPLQWTVLTQKEEKMRKEKEEKKRKEEKLRKQKEDERKKEKSQKEQDVYA